MKGPAARAFVTAASVALLGLMGCQPSDPLDRTVAARNPRALASWRAGIESSTGLETRKRVEVAFQEIRVNVVADREIRKSVGETVPAGTEYLDEAVCERVNGRTLGEVMQLGYEMRLVRLRRELAALEEAMSQNAELTTRPGDLESKHHLERLRDRQMGRVEAFRADIAEAERELAPLQKRTGRRFYEVPAERPAPTSAGKV